MLRMELPNDMRCVDAAASFVSSLATEYGVAAEKAGTVHFMVETALEVRAKELAEQNAAVTVELEERASEFVIRIMDKGLPYVISPYQKEVFRKSNLGRLLFEQLGADGQRLTFFITQEHDYVMPQPPAPLEETLEDREVTCRRTQPTPEDTLEAIRCLYEVYRYEYLHQELYHTEQFVKLLNSGTYVSILAENAHHQVLGHMALQEHDWFAGLREACNLVVKPMARGLGLSNLLCNELLDIAISDDAYNLYAMPVLYHPISQKLLNNAEFVPCGLYANLLDMSCIEGFEDDEGKCSVAFCFHQVKSATSQALYLPKECAGFVRDVYNAAGLSLEAGKAESFAHEVSSVMQSIDTVHRSLSVKIDAIGPDLYDRLEAWQLHNDRADLDVAILYLNDRDPQAPECYRYFRERGYVFTGCLPGATDGDYLLLQHLNGRPFNREGSVLLPNYADMIERLYQINSI